jgi:ADP-heptose:LPS heptosyltransferase
MDEYKNYKNLIDLGSGFESFDDTAGALMNMDLVITVDTSVAHLAGALGVKTFMLLPYVTDWRWFDNTEKTEWYDSVRIFKQESQTDWESVFNKVAGEIKKLVNIN